MLQSGGACCVLQSGGACCVLQFGSLTRYGDSNQEEAEDTSSSVYY